MHTNLIQDTAFLNSNAQMKPVERGMPFFLSKAVVLNRNKLIKVWKILSVDTLYTETVNVNHCAAYRKENTSISEHIQCILMSMWGPLTNSMLRVEHTARCVLLAIHLLKAFQYISLWNWLTREAFRDHPGIRMHLIMSPMSICTYCSWLDHLKNCLADSFAHCGGYYL